jgi:hypothetical protein
MNGFRIWSPRVSSNFAAQEQGKEGSNLKQNSRTSKMEAIWTEPRYAGGSIDLPNLRSESLVLLAMNLQFPEILLKGTECFSTTISVYVVTQTLSQMPHHEHNLKHRAVMFVNTGMMLTVLWARSGSVVVKALCYKSGSKPDEVNNFFQFPATLDAGIHSAFNINEYDTKRNVSGSRALPVRKADNFTATCGPIV